MVEMILNPDPLRIFFEELLWCNFTSGSRAAPTPGGADLPCCCRGLALRRGLALWHPLCLRRSLCPCEGSTSIVAVMVATVWIVAPLGSVPGVTSVRSVRLLFGRTGRASAARVSASVARSSAACHLSLLRCWGGLRRLVSLPHIVNSSNLKQMWYIRI